MSKKQTIEQTFVCFIERLFDETNETTNLKASREHIKVTNRGKNEKSLNCINETKLQKFGYVIQPISSKLNLRHTTLTQ